MKEQRQLLWTHKDSGDEQQEEEAAASWKQPLLKKLLWMQHAAVAVLKQKNVETKLRTLVWGQHVDVVYLKIILGAVVHD